VDIFIVCAYIKWFEISKIHQNFYKLFNHSLLEDFDIFFNKNRAKEKPSSAYIAINLSTVRPKASGSDVIVVDITRKLSKMEIFKFVNVPAGLGTGTGLASELSPRP